MDAEVKLIERITKAIAAGGGAAGRAGLVLGIGDDAAILGHRAGTEWILSCDAFLEDVHFWPDRHPPDSVGYKALARAASDLAAMGATPRVFLLTLALPAARTGRWLDGFLRGMRGAARLLRMRLVGGDTTRSGVVSISIAVLGEVSRGLAVRRSGARPGDIIYVSGTLGRAALGLELVKAAPPGTLRRLFRDQSQILQPHLYPEIRVALGTWLARHKIPSAMMDISDGLSTDLARLCQASRVGARLDAARIPCVTIPEAASKASPGRNLEPLRLALDGGEDYELLFTVPRRKLRELRGAPGFAEVTAIGEIEPGRQVTFVGADGRGKRLDPGGWDPFSRK